jgi:hypothetical protein
MAHFGVTLNTRPTTPNEWLRVGAKIGELVNTWSYRDDLIVNLSEETSNKAPALFNPKSSEVEVSIPAFAGATPEEVGDLTQRMSQLAHPVVSGAVFHEACHARYSRYSLEEAHKDLTAAEFESLMLLEEGRIESWGVRTTPDNQVLLFSCAMKIVLSDLESYLPTIDTIAGSARLAGLSLARVDAGVLEFEDVEPVRDAIMPILSEEVLEKLRSVWIRFQAHADHNNATELYTLAKEWVSIIEERQEEVGEDVGSGMGEPQDGEAGDSEGGSSELSDTAKRIIEALKEADELTEIAVREAVGDAQTRQEWKDEVDARSAKSKEESENRDVANEVFQVGAGTGETPKKRSNSRLVETRKPTPEERASAVKMARLLEKAKYRNRNEIQINSPLPGGRLRTRAVVQAQALKAKGVFTPADVWRQTKRKHTEQPDLKVGIMVDISGSMGQAMQPMATTAWVLSEAVRRIQGTAAMVYFGEDVFPTLKPGQHLREVQVYNAPDNTEKFGKAFKALNGAMNLSNGTGARLLVVVSDGHYTYEERAIAKESVEKAIANGVAVLWIQMQGGYNAAQDYLKNTSVQIVVIDTAQPATEWAGVIGKAGADALTKIGRKLG